jgi:hypothetical protein
MVRRLFFLCGIAASLVLVAAVVAGGLMRPDYDHLSMAISALVAPGAANKPLLDALFIAANALLLLFAWAVGMSVRGDGKGSAVTGAVLLAVAALLGLAFPLFPAATTGTLHLALSVALSVVSVLAVLFLALGMKDRDAFWVYSMVSAILLLVSGALAAAAAIQANPLMGLAERVSVGLFLQWIILVSGRFVKEDLGR